MRRMPLTKHRIGVLRKRLRELAQDSGVHLATLSNVERGYWHQRRRDREWFAGVYGLPLETYEEMVKAAQETREPKAAVEARESA